MTNHPNYSDPYETAMIKCPVDGCPVELPLRNVAAQVEHMNGGDAAHQALISKRLQGLEGRNR